MYGNKIKIDYEEFLNPRNQFHKTKLQAEVDQTDFETARKTKNSRQAEQTFEKNRTYVLKRENIEVHVNKTDFENDRQARNAGEAIAEAELEAEEKIEREEEISSAEVKAAGIFLR